MRAHRYEELSADAFQKIVQETSLVYFPIGSLEFHGVHLPLGMDTINAYEFCLQAAAETGGVVLPPTYWGAEGHVGWPGSLLVRQETFRMLVEDVFALLAEQGVRLVVATTGHWPARQGVAIAELARRAMERRPFCRILTLDMYTANPTDPACDHAGRKETSIMLAFRPELVHPEKLSGGDEVFRGVGRDCVQGTAAFGRDYLQASLANYVRQVRAAMVESP
jgi:creatinine amidohydrolase